MISKKIKNAAERVMPKEKKFIDGIRRFWEKKPRRLIVSGLIAVVLLYPIYCMTCDNINDRYNALMLVLGFVQVTASGAFFANINEFSLKKYACAVSVWSVALYLATVMLGALAGMDPADPMQVVPGCIGLVLMGIPICATIIALSVLLAYFTVCGMEAE